MRPGGRVAFIGDYLPPFNHFIPLGTAMNRNLTLRTGQVNVPNYIDDLMERTRRGEIDPSAIVTHELPLEDAPHAYEIFERKLDGASKCF